MEELDNIELKDIPQSETIANEEDQETKTTENSSTPKTSKGKKKKLIIIGGVILLIAVILISLFTRGNFFAKAVSEMLEEYPYADNTRGSDGSWLAIDTDPYDGDYSDPMAEILHEKKASDSLGGIQFMNEKCGFPDSVYKRMMSTSALMGQQSEENKKFRVSWTYHPDRGLEVLYEKK